MNDICSFLSVVSFCHYNSFFSTQLLYRAICTLRTRRDPSNHRLYEQWDMIFIPHCQDFELTNLFRHKCVQIPRRHSDLININWVLFVILIIWILTIANRLDIFFSLPMLSIGVDRVVDQVVNPKIEKDFKPQIDKIICETSRIRLWTMDGKAEWV